MAEGWAYSASDGFHPLSFSRAEQPVALHERAMDNLKFIRETMERASAFTGISGWGQVRNWRNGNRAAFIAARQPTFKAWLAVWLAEAVVSLLIAGWSIDRKSSRSTVAPSVGPGRKVAF
jgi:hypothetical protein